MTDEIEKCKCGRPATGPEWYSDVIGRPTCMICHLVSRFSSSPPRLGPGNMGDDEIKQWMRKQLRRAIEEMVSLMRADVLSLMQADLDAFAKKWSPPTDDSTQDGDQK